MADGYAHVYLSPHYDDASLSCGGAIFQQAGQGQPPLVVTVFAAPPHPGQALSPFAENMHRHWGSPADVVGARQAEDRASMAILGADYLRLNLLDCIYRGRPEAGEWYYTGEADLFGQVHPAETGAAAAIAAAFLELVPFQPDTVVYAPLAVGHHVDHQLAHAAVWQLRQQGWTIAFYEDYPYADPGYPFTRPANPWEHGHTLAAALAARAPAKLQPQLCYLSEADLQARIDSVAAYASQAPVLFGSQAAMAHHLRQYALRAGQGQPAERTWRPGAVTGPAPATGDRSWP
jgi:LmbE family N-acetylglucosaminyl deacetylase